MAGPEPGYHASQYQPAVHMSNVDNTKDLSDVTVGVFWEWFNDADAEVVAACKKQVEFLKSRGAKVSAALYVLKGIITYICIIRLWR